MGQKSRNKKQKANKSTQNKSLQQPMAQLEDRQSLVAASAGFQPKTSPASANGATHTAALGVDSGDMRRIVILFGIVLAIFVALAIINTRSSAIGNAGIKLVHALNF